MATLGTGQLTAIDVSPLDYVSIAAEAGLDTVSLFINPMGSIQGECLTTHQTADAMKQRLRDTGLRLANVEAFPLAPGIQVDGYRPVLELGADLGARGATVLLYDDDEERVADSLALMCDMASELGLRIGVEFMPLAPKWKTLRETVQLIKQVAKPNLGIGVDLLHLVRSGGTPADVAATEPGLIFYAQLCDSENLDATEDYVEEASEHRLTPGAGKFPIREFLQALPEGTPLELEVPQKSSTPAGERVKAIVEATREQLNLVGLQ